MKKGTRMLADVENSGNINVIKIAQEILKYKELSTDT
jgi:hypothetical protein